MALLLMTAGFSLAASMDTYARVDLVQGVQARVNLVPRVEAQLLSPTGPLNDNGSKADLLQLNLSGPESLHVDVRLSPLAQGAAWSDSPKNSALAVDSHHNAAGSLVMDLPLGHLEDRSNRYVLSLTYE